MNIIKRQNQSYPNMNSLVKNFFSDDFFQWPANRWESGRHDLPAVNISEDENGYRIDLAAPGMTKDDFKIELKDDRLTISAESKSDKKESSERFTRREFSFKSFSRSFILPEGAVNQDVVTAGYENGVLSLNLPKKEEAKPSPAKMIEIS